MATLLTTLATKVRNLLGDFSITQKDVFTYASSAIFTLTQNNPVAVTIVYKNSVELSSSLWSFDSDTNKVTLTGTLTTGDTIEIDYTCYLNYSTAEINAYIQSAIIYLSINNYYDFRYDSTTSCIYPELEEREENLIAMVTSVLVEEPIQALRLPDLTINFPNNLNKDSKISKIISIYKKDNSGIIDLI